MARARSPERDRARELWLTNKERPLKDIAQELGIAESRIRKWKCEDKWEQNAKGTFPLTQKERSHSKRLDKKLVQAVEENDELDKKLVQAVEENDELTEKEKAFCIHHVKTFNATAACRAAGYDTQYPSRVGWELLQKPHIQDEIKRLKEIRNMAMLGGAEDILELHWRIAFADMTDYANWSGGSVTFNSSQVVDGQLVKEIKQGEMGLGLKLADKQKSLSFLERYYEMHPMDKHKKAFDEAKLALERQKKQADTEIEDLSSLAEMLK